MSFLKNLPESLVSQLKISCQNKRVAFPERNDERVLQAAKFLKNEFNISIYKEDWNHQKLVQEACQKVSLARGKEPKNLSQETLSDTFFQSGALLSFGHVDAVVGGCVATTSHVIRAALSTVGLNSQTALLTSCFLMLLREPTEGGESVLCVSDGAVLPSPSEKELADIAVLASEAFQQWTGKNAKVSFLSFSTQGSAEHEMVQKVRNAATRFRHLCPRVTSEGEVQLDAALSPSVCKRKFSDSKIQGASNVLVFPCLNSANIAYKTMERIGGARALGPVLLGVQKPFSDLSRGAKTEDICLVTLLTLALSK